VKVVRACVARTKSRRGRLIADQRGAVSFELVMVYPLLLLGIMLPLADLAIAGFRYLSAREALHAFGQSILYSPPDDLANTSDWFSATLTKAGQLDYPISNFQLVCGDGGAACSSGNTASPKYYSFDTTVTLAPIILSSLLCSGSCTYTLSYSARFQ
jgi:hypothetical protein